LAANDTEEIQMPASTHARHKRRTPNRARQGAALGVTGAVSLGMVMAGAGTAAAADTPVSQARGWFLSGSALGTNLDNIAELQGAKAKNYGGHTVTQLNPLSATLLNSIHVPLGPINVPGSGVLQLGAVNQAAIARASGSAVGASGAVTNSGAIAVGGQNGVPAANATLDLGGALPSTLATALTDVDLNVGALAASAKQLRGHNGTQTGDYRIAQLTLSLKSPLLSGVLGTVTPVLAGLQGQVLGAVNLVQGLSLATISDLPVLALDTTLGGSGPVGVNLTTGAITVNVEALLQSLGLDLNNLPPNTELMPLIVNAISTHVVGLVTDELSALAGRITTAVDNVTVTSPLGALDPALALVTPALNALLPTLLGPLTTERNSLAGTNSLLDPVFAALSSVLSLEVNVQERANHAFTERALVIRVLPGASPLARVNLASASVGPGNGPGTDSGSGDGSSVDALPHTGTAGNVGVGVAGLALVVAGGAAMGAGRSRGRHARR
jgi:LPXTG-motif cell wall-anchored protein